MLLISLILAAGVNCLVPPTCSEDVNGNSSLAGIKPQGYAPVEQSLIPRPGVSFNQRRSLFVRQGCPLQTIRCTSTSCCGVFDSCCGTGCCASGTVCTSTSSGLICCAFNDFSGPCGPGGGNSNVSWACSANWIKAYSNYVRRLVQPVLISVLAPTGVVRFPRTVMLIILELHSVVLLHPRQFQQHQEV
jgi:hypothetical protein